MCAVNINLSHWPVFCQLLLFFWMYMLLGLGRTQQVFRTTPSDTSVVRGHTAILKCEIDNRQGQVQWTKDGFGFGYVYSIPGYPRYSMIVNEQNGQFDLQVVNADLSDDASYQCQVQRTPSSPQLSATAKLSILLPPEVPEIEAIRNGTWIVMRPGDQRNFTCNSNNGKPAATLKWYSNSYQITNNVWYFIEDHAIQNSNAKLEDARSTLLFEATEQDNGIEITCEAHSPALELPMRTSLFVNVQFPPSPPSISGYTEGEHVRQGDTVILICTSYGGNPLADLKWYKNGESIDFKYETSERDRLSRNVFEFVAQPSDNKAVFRCEATNIVQTVPTVAHVQMKVFFPPEQLTITGPDDAAIGENITLKCTSAHSNPPTELSWVADGRAVTVKTHEVIPSEEGGFITESEITISVTRQQRNVIIQCFGMQLGNTMTETKDLSVLYPPEQPTILGYSEGTSIRSQTLQRLTCVAVGGNPLADVKWYKGNEELTGDNVHVEETGNVISSQIVIVTAPSDNGASYKCTASNTATKKPLKAQVRLTVDFPPDAVEISINPPELKAGAHAIIFCESSSSNPASTITWFKGGTEFEGITNGTYDGDYGGKKTRSYLSINVTHEDNQALITCKARNAVLEQSTHQAVTLNVLFRPIFDDAIPKKIDVVEGAPLIVNYSAIANPSDVKYSWSVDGEKFTEIRGGLGEDHINVEDNVLKVLHVYKNDTNKYSLKAKNSEGARTINIKINVMYPAKITKVTSPVIVDQGQPVLLECYTEANPVTDTLVTWSRENYDMSRVNLGINKLISSLTIDSTRKEDSGMFVCTAFNGIGEHDMAQLELIVQFKPQIDRSPRFAKAASENGETARLHCIAQGSPSITFSWSRAGAKVNTTWRKFDIEFTQYDKTYYESILLIHTVNHVDHGEYTCTASNDLGMDQTTVKLTATSRPDAPTDIAIIDKTYSTIKLAWTPGFDGGLKQAFRVRYRWTESPQYHYVDVLPHNATVFVVRGLERNTEYELSVMGFNSLGDSGYQKRYVTTKTASEIPPEEFLSVKRGSGKIPLIIIVSVCIAGAILLAFNIVLIIYFIRRRKQKKLEDAVVETESKSNTVEMYSHMDDLARDDFSEGGGGIYVDKTVAGSRGFYLDDATLENANLYQSGSPTYKTFREAYAGSHMGSQPRVVDDDMEDLSDALRRQQYGYGRIGQDPYSAYARLQTSQGNLPTVLLSNQGDARMRQQPPAPPTRSVSNLGSRSNVHPSSHYHMNGGISTMPSSQPRYVPDPTSQQQRSTTPYQGYPTVPLPQEAVLPHRSGTPYSRPKPAPPSPPITVRPHRTNPRVTPRAYDYIDSNQLNIPMNQQRLHRDNSKL